MRVALLVLMIFSAELHADQAARARAPWEWTLEERIEARCDRALARERVGSAREQKIKDVIDGKRSPHLFLPTELFESIVRNGFLAHGWREAFADQIIASGLPADFWVKLEPIVALYVSDLAEQRPGPLLCRDRADSLRAARAAFGGALDVFMYRHVAPSRTDFIDHVEQSEQLLAREQGCR